MTDREKQRLSELEEKTAYILKRQDEQETRMSQILARLTYIESCQHRLMKQLGIKPDTLDTLQAAQDDAKAINLTALPEQRLN
ncbi:hypothetical protein [Spirosoma pollinicola]|uniref:Uncharacterized protein n=1 Tax=Spirosoma pollinicola TaxID=2057025 RepID=A0A2K8Z5C9_9BACT|nr:hypothetical protein [Spirosoma pollinicola]AUD05083.1 hypothetical protein CWM47_26505 [Spirosoma pollinicola]